MNLSIYESINLYIYLSVNLSIYHLSIYHFTNQSSYLSVYQSCDLEF